MFPNQVITESNLVDEMEKSYIEYAMSVIVGRALPDVRDGLKPVHRRILYTMYESGLTSDKPFKKSATCVGDVLGKYHPHGDASVYDAMVRLAQNFSMRYVLVDGHGNFGSVDGDPAAAYRYTEARLSKLSNEMLRDIDKETVNWDPNFDETRKEPRVLPSRFPNLLVNGSSGIAVGMATNIPPHNLTEVINACVAVIDDPECSMVDLMEHVSGPDFPTGGIIMGRSGIRAAYATGRGKVVVRARTEFEEFGKDRIRIIVSELPYQVNKRQLIKNIAEQVKDKRIEGISDLRDETDRNGMRMVIELKKDANPQVVLNTLFKQTALQSSFGIIMLALVNDQKQPKILSLRQIIDEYLAFQMEVLTRRTQYDLRKARERAHLLEGLLIAQDNIDEVIRIIRSRYDDAKEALMERYGLDAVQAQAILDMRLKALQGLDREKLQAEYDELMVRINYYLELLADESKLRGVLREELIEIRDKFGDKRKTEIQDIEDEIDIEDLIEEETCVFTLSNQGYVKRMPVDTYRTQGRGGRGVNAQNLKEEDYVKSLNIASTHDYILFFTNIGKVYLRKAQERAHLLEGLLIAQDNIDEVIRIIRTAYDDAKQRLMERFGLDDIQAQAILDMRLKALQGLDREKLQNEFNELQERIRYYQDLLADPVKMRAVLREELIEIRDKFGDKRKTEIQEIEDEIDIEDLIEEETCAFTLSNQGYIKRMPVDTYRTQSRGGRGVSAQNLKEEDYVKSLNIASTHDHMLFFTDLGRVHHRKGYQIPEAGRTARGTAIVNVLPLEPGESVTAMVITREFNEEEFLMMCTRKGTVKRIPFVALKTNRKGGIRAITLDEDDHLINVIRTKGDDNIILATAEGMAICFNENDVRPMGRDAAGVRGTTCPVTSFTLVSERKTRIC